MPTHKPNHWNVATYTLFFAAFFISRQITLTSAYSLQFGSDGTSVYMQKLIAFSFILSLLAAEVSEQGVIAPSIDSSQAQMFFALIDMLSCLLGCLWLVTKFTIQRGVTKAGLHVVTTTPIGYQKWVVIVEVSSSSLRQSENPIRVSDPSWNRNIDRHIFWETNLRLVLFEYLAPPLQALYSLGRQPTWRSGEYLSHKLRQVSNGSSIHTWFFNSCLRITFFIRD